MNTKNETFTPRDRVDASLMRELLREDAARTEACSCQRQSSVRRTSTAPKAGSRCPACGKPLAMVYAPAQTFGELYEAEDGLSRGTIFKELDLPLTVGWCNEGRCVR